MGQLNLGDNRLGAESGQAMVEALKVNTKLASLAVDGHALLIRQLSGAEAIASINLSKKELGKPPAS